MLSAGSRSGLLLCEERLVGKVCGSALMAWQQWAATEATVRDAGTQEVERHVGDSSTGPTLRTERRVKEVIWRMQGYYIQSQTNHSEQSAVLEIGMELQESCFCTGLPLNKPTKNQDNERYHMPTLEKYSAKVLQKLMCEPWQKLKNGSAPRLKDGDDCRPVSGVRIT